MDDDELLKEFCEDFSAPGPDDAALTRILELAQSAKDADLRRLVTEVRYWRFMALLLLERVAPKGTPIDEHDPLLKIARFQIRGEGSVGSKRHGR